MYKRKLTRKSTCETQKQYSQQHRKKPRTNSDFWLALDNYKRDDLHTKLPKRCPWQCGCTKNDKYKYYVIDKIGDLKAHKSLIYKGQLQVIGIRLDGYDVIQITTWDIQNFNKPT